MVARIETGFDMVLVLFGVSTELEILRYPYRPKLVLKGVGDIPGEA